MSQEEARYDVFISYNHEDREQVERVVHFLKGEGLEVFSDDSSMSGGQPSRKQLEDALRDSRAVAVFLGPHGIGKFQWQEKDLALDRKVEKPSLPVIPILLPGGKPDKGFLSLQHMVDLSHGVDDSKGLRKLLDALRVDKSVPKPKVVDREGVSAEIGLDKQAQAKAHELQKGPEMGEQRNEGGIGSPKPSSKLIDRLRLFLARARERGGFSSLSWPNRKSVRISRKVLIGLAVGLGLVTFLFVLREKNAKLAKQEEILRSSILASDALQLKDRGRDVAMLLSLEADQIAHTIEARANLLTLLQESPRLRYFLPGDKKDRSWAAFDPTSRRIFSGGSRFLYLWEPAAANTVGLVARPLASFDQRKIDLGSDAAIVSLALSPDGNLLVMSKEKESLIHRYSGNGAPLTSIVATAGTEKIDNLTFSPRDPELLAYSVKDQIFLRDLKKQNTLTLSKHTAFVSKLAFSPDGRTLASAGLDQAVYLWKVPSRQAWREPDKNEIAKLETKPEEGGFNAIAFSNDGKVLAVAGNSIQLWDIQLTKLRMRLRDGSPKSPVLAVAFSPNGRTIASAGMDRQIRLWPLAETEDTRPASYLVGHGGAIWSLSFNKDGELLSSGDGGEVILWDPDPDSPPPLARALIKDIRAFKSLALNSDASILALGGEESGLTLYDGTLGRLRGAMESRHDRPVKSLAFDEAGRVLASGDEAGRLLVWKDGAFPKPIKLPNRPGETDPILSLALTPDGKRGAVATAGKRVFIWEVDGEGPTALPPTPGDKEVSVLAFDPSGAKLVTAGDRQLTIWDIAKLKPLFIRREAHDEAITRLAFHPEGHLLASGSVDGTVRLWRVEDDVPQQGDEIPELPQSGGAIPVSPTSALAWSQDGMILAAGGGDGTIALWDAKEHRLIGSGLRGNGTDHIAGLAFRRDGRLVSLSGTQLREWDLRYESWRSYACSLLRWSLLQPERWTIYLEWQPHEICPASPSENLQRPYSE